MNLTGLRNAVNMSIETSDEGVGFRVNMTKLTEKADKVGFIPLWYRTSVNSEKLHTDDVVLLSAFGSGKDISWFTKDKQIATLIFVNKDDVDENLQDLLDQIDVYRKNTKPINYPGLHDRLLHYGSCIYTEDDRAINVVNTIVAKYKTVSCLIGKGANIVIKFRDSENTPTEIEVNPTSGYAAIVEVAGKAVYYKNVVDAFNDLEDGGTLTLNNDAVINENIAITKNCTIEAPEGKTYSITTDESFIQNPDNKIGALFSIKSKVDVTFRNLTINSKGKTRAIVAQAGTLTMDNCTITGNKYSYPGGIYVTKSAEVTMTNCNVVDNDVSDEYLNDTAIVACKDIWVGANAKCVLDNTNAGNVYVNSNSYSKSNKGYLEVVNASKINQVYLEFDEGYGADMLYNDGTIKKLIAVASDGETLVTITDPLESGKMYSGGVAVPTTVSEENEDEVE
ncbi:MAG: right-handed parallel beta-helix repeat-containing protein [Lachnospiraceae bacterium]|nr:right-handed parallel beta-helix repeat-containing protein [Lachnospiraceae bacterium]